MVLRTNAMMDDTSSSSVDSGTIRLKARVLHCRPLDSRLSLQRLSWAAHRYTLSPIVPRCGTSRLMTDRELSVQPYCQY